MICLALFEPSVTLGATILIPNGAEVCQDTESRKRHVGKRCGSSSQSTVCISEISQNRAQTNTMVLRDFAQTYMVLIDFAYTDTIYMVLRDFAHTDTMFLRDFAHTDSTLTIGSESGV